MVFVLQFSAYRCHYACHPAAAASLAEAAMRRVQLTNLASRAARDEAAASDTVVPDIAQAAHQAMASGSSPSSGADLHSNKSGTRPATDASNTAEATVPRLERSEPGDTDSASDEAASHSEGAAHSEASHDDDVESEEADKDHRADADILAQLSQSMWAALSPAAAKSTSKAAQNPPVAADTAQEDRLTEAHPENLQPAGTHHPASAVHAMHKMSRAPHPCCMQCLFQLSQHGQAELVPGVLGCPSCPGGSKRRLQARPAVHGTVHVSAFACLSICSRLVGCGMPGTSHIACM